MGVSPESSYGYEQAGLMKVEAGSGKAEIVHRFSEGALPRSLKINGSGDTIYYLNDGVYRKAVADERSRSFLLDSPYPKGYQGGYYALEVDPLTSELYLADALDFVQRGLDVQVQSSGRSCRYFPDRHWSGRILFQTLRIFW